jgi:hypothetical protein
MSKLQYGYNSLSDFEKKVVILLCEEGLDMKEISQCSNKSYASTKRAISSLKDIFNANNLAQLGANWIKYKSECIH